MITITTGNQKGGVGKSTITELLALYLASLGGKKKGYRVLMVDLDPQFSLSLSSGIDYEPKKSIYHVFMDMMDEPDSIDVDLRPYIQNVADNIDLIYGGARLKKADGFFTGSHQELYLAGVLENIKDDYDFCLIDTPGADGVLFNNAIAAADYVIVPMTPTLYDLGATPAALKRIDEIREKWNPNIKLAGILFNRVKNISAQKYIMDQARNELSNYRFFQQVVREAAIIQTAQVANKSLFSESSKVKNDITEVIRELIMFMKEDE